jgi:hypothetical protein
VSLGRILDHADAVGVHQAEVLLRHGIPMLGRFAIPLHGFRRILGHSGALGFYQRPVCFRICHCRPARWAGNPATGRAYSGQPGLKSRNQRTLVLHPAEFVLRVSISLFGFFPRLTKRLRKSDRNQKSGRAKDAGKKSHA